MKTCIVWIVLPAAQCYNSGPSHCVREFPQAHGQRTETTQGLSGGLDMDRASDVGFNHSSFPPRNGPLPSETLIRIPGQIPSLFMKIQFLIWKISKQLSHILLQNWFAVAYDPPFPCEFFYTEPECSSLSESIMMLDVCYRKDGPAVMNLCKPCNFPVLLVSTPAGLFSTQHIATLKNIKSFLHKSAISLMNRKCDLVKCEQFY